jgi:hypothetical protein
MSGSFIYFLMDGVNILYIGKSRNLPERIRNHNSSKLFTHVRFIRVDDSLLEHYEKRLIAYFKPKENRQFINRKRDFSCDSLLTITEFATKFNIPRTTAWKWVSERKHRRLKMYDASVVTIARKNFVRVK